MSKLFHVKQMNGVWKAIDENCYAWNGYRIYRSVQGWTCWAFGDHSRRVGNSDLMSKAMEMARKDHETQT